MLTETVGTTPFDRRVLKGSNVRLLSHDQRCRVLKLHRDGTVTVRAMFSLDSNRDDVPGTYMGWKYGHLRPEEYEWMGE